MDVYIRKVLRVSVAQICQTIGYNSIQTIPLELLIDSLHKFLQEFARDLHRHVELFNRTESNLDDVALSLQSLNIGVNDLLEYINHVQPVACCIEIPELPALKQSNLNFLKPGSKEVLTRPVHIYEHLPPILRDSCELDDKSQISNAESSPASNVSNSTNNTTNCNEVTEEVVTKTNGVPVPDTNESSDPSPLVAENLAGSPAVEVKKKQGLDATASPPPSAVPSSATREISSVMMTSGGFISPAIEGRMPECNIPDIVDKYFGLDAPPAPAPAPAPPNLVPPSALSGKSTTVSSSQSTANSASLRCLVKNEDSAVSSSAKLYQNVDKKLMKKVKKKSLIPMGPPNISGVVPVMPNDKAQRKRIKMLQKSMAKNNPNGGGGVFKTKTGTSFVPGGQQEKFRKKQYKLRQKQIHQLAQKQMDAVEAALSTTSGATGSGRSSNPAHASQSVGLGGSGGSGKMKKDYFVIPQQIGDEPPTDMPSSSSFLTPVPFHPFKGSMYNEAALNSQDMVVNPAAVSSQQSVLHGPPSPQYEEVKLSNEPDRSKLNIFKKISSRKERTEAAAAAAAAQAAPPTGSNPTQSAGEASAVATSSNTTIFSNDQVISLPSGTTITPAPPSGSGRHVYAPPPSTQSGDFDSVVQVDDDGSIPEGSAVLMKRGDLMIHKPKKRGRKPGSKNQPKILGFPTKKTKKLKKTLFGSHTNANLLEPLNLSHSSIANIANIPLGIASTFPLDPEAATKMKKDRKKAKLGKDPNFLRATGKSSSTRNLAPTKEEFASINQKLMMMDTVLQAAPPFPSNIHSPSSSKVARPNSPGLEVSSAFPIEPESGTKIKKERKKTKQSKDQKLLAQQCGQPLSSGMQGSNKTSPNMGASRKSPQPYANFSNVPGMGGLPMFSFFPYTARPGLIPSHNIFSQIPNMQNNGLFMPPLMGFQPLNPPIRSFLKDEKEPTPPLLQAGEGNYSKVAPLVPETMKLEFTPSTHTSTSSSGLSGSKAKNSSSASTTSLKAGSATTSGPSFALDSSIGSSVTSTQMNTIGHFGDMRKKVEEANSSTVVSSSSANAITSLRNIDVTIEVSSDDSIQDGISSSKTKFSSRITNSTAVSSTSSFNRLSHSNADFSASDNVNIVNDSETSPTERRNKEHKKLKKLGKQGKKHATLSGSMELKNSNRSDSGGFDDDLSSMIMSTGPDSSKKNDEMANSSGHTAYDYQISPERRKDHKKMKKLLKEGKLKKKKDKKDKNRNKERGEKLIKADKAEKRKEEKKDKDKLKKLKKEKKKDKQRSDMDVASIKYTSSGEGTGSATEVSSVVPKLTLKLGQSSQSPTQLESSELRKTGQKSGLNLMNTIGGGKPPGGSIIGTSSGREPSPELARISPLVTRPPKQKSGTDEPVSSSCVISPVGNASSSTGQTSSGSHQTPSLSASLNIIVDSVIDVDSNSGGPTTSTLPASATILGLGINASSNSSPGNNPIGGSSIGSTTAAAPIHATNTQHSQHQASHQNASSSNKHSAAVPLLSETNRPSSYIDAEGNRVWICPACGKVDDGSAMIGCDGCDAWYHWVCVGILVAPNDNEDWYCRVCITKKRGAHNGDRKRKRNKKKNLNS